MKLFSQQFVGLAAVLPKGWIRGRHVRLPGNVVDGGEHLCHVDVGRKRKMAMAQKWCWEAVGDSLIYKVLFS